MKKIPIKAVNETLYYEKLENGLEVYILPNQKVTQVYGTFTTKYGGIDNVFVPQDGKKLVEVPTGIAHFLEHKMFECEDGMDPFTFFAKTGTNSNAYTSYKSTTYLFLANQEFDKNLCYLLDFVQEPYFTDENVEKEKGIIEQEIKMYEDEAGWVLYETMLSNLLKKDPHRISLIGKVEDIRRITKEDLYRCYYTFYHPSNMFVVVTGNVEPEHTMEVIRRNQAGKTFTKESPIKRKHYEEPKEVAVSYEGKIFPVEIPKLAYGVKIPKKEIPIKETYKVDKYFALLMTCLFGSTSRFDEEMKEKGYLVSNIGYEVYDVEDYYLLMLIADTNYPKELEVAIDKEFKTMDLKEADIERLKKVAMSSEIATYDQIVVKNKDLMESVILYNKVLPNEIELLKSLKLDELKKMIQGLDFQNKAVVVLRKE